MIKKIIKNFIGDAGTRNLIDRQLWVKEALQNLPKGARLLDAGAGEQQYKQYCSHLNYVSQDFCEYEGEGNKHGLQTGTWDVSKIDIVSDINNIPEPDASFDSINTFMNTICQRLDLILSKLVQMEIIRLMLLKN